jgi:hypothetical protein
MKNSRQLHVWIGLLCSVLILIESITGLLLSEPWLMGMDGKREMKPPRAVLVNGSGLPEGGNNLMGIVRELHEGRIGGMDVTWLADLAAVAMIILTVTGISLSIQTLRAQRLRKRKTLQASYAQNYE